MNEEIICYCKNISKAEILSAIAKGAKTLKDVQEMTSACTGNACIELNPKGVCCAEDILKLLPPSDKKCSCCC
ncbi:MAG TPA: (2Fe-2S)-binding protein [Bacteroidales bacterium]|jgi:NAD(P)H-nitrite reductase large subunit|nr:(2Fe-2S)-binding protein [Bacteroidales bacterium]